MKIFEELKPIIILIIGLFLGYGSVYFSKDHTNPRSYQIQLQDTTALLYDGNNLIGRFELTGDLDELIIKDNH